MAGRASCRKRVSANSSISGVAQKARRRRARALGDAARNEHVSGGPVGPSWLWSLARSGSESRPDDDLAGRVSRKLGVVRGSPAAVGHLHETRASGIGRGGSRFPERPCRAWRCAFSSPRSPAVGRGHGEHAPTRSLAARLAQAAGDTVASLPQASLVASSALRARTCASACARASARACLCGE